MPLSPPDLPDKKFFSMGEVSHFCGVPPHTIRYWEKRVGILRPTRIPSGHRRYEKKDIECLFRIKTLLQNREVTLSGARKIILRESRGRGVGTEGSVMSEVQRPNRNFLKLIQETRSEIQALLDEL